MASTILLSDNGVSSGSAGLKETGGNDGVLILQSTTAGGTATTAVTIDNSQNMGLGVTPSAWGSGIKAIQIGGSNGYISYNNINGGYTYWNMYNDGSNNKTLATGNIAAYGLNTSGQHVWFNGTGTTGTTSSLTQAMTLDASGNLLVGGTAQVFGEKLLLKTASGDCYTTMSNGTGSVYVGWSSSGVGFMGTATNHAQTFYTNGTERARIDSSGALLIGETSNSSADGKFSVNQPSTSTVEGARITSAGQYSALYINETNTSYTSSVFAANCQTASGTGYNLFACQNPNGIMMRVLGNGNVQNVNNSYGAISDIKLKENITDATAKLNGLLQVRVVNYNLKTNPEHKQLGVIAQELEQVFPGMVDETIDRDEKNNDLGTTTKYVKYSVFVPMLIKAIQEQQAIIESLKARLDAANL